MKVEFQSMISTLPLREGGGGGETLHWAPSSKVAPKAMKALKIYGYKIA